MRPGQSFPILLLVLLFPLTAFAGEKEKLDAGEILVETADVAGSDVPSITVTGVINVAPERVWAILEDCENYAGRLPRIDESREISRDGDIVICEVTVGLPFPMSDLSSQTRAVHTVGPPSWKREWTLIEGNYKINDGSWTLTTFNGDDSRTLAVYTVHAEPESRVPNRIRRRAQESSMPDIIETLRELTGAQ